VNKRRKPAGLRQRGNSYSIARTVPKELQGKGPFITDSGKPQREIVEALNTNDYETAINRLNEKHVEYDRLFELEKFKLQKPKLKQRDAEKLFQDEQRKKLAPFDPDKVNLETEVLDFFARLERESERGIPEYLSTHSEEQIQEQIQTFREDAADYVGPTRGLFDFDGAKQVIKHFESKRIRIGAEDKDLQHSSDARLWRTSLGTFTGLPAEGI